MHFFRYLSNFSGHLKTGSCHGRTRGQKKGAAQLQNSWLDGLEVTTVCVACTARAAWSTTGHVLADRDHRQACAAQQWCGAGRRLRLTHVGFSQKLWSFYCPLLLLQCQWRSQENFDFLHVYSPSKSETGKTQKRREKLFNRYGPAWIQTSPNAL